MAGDVICAIWGHLQIGMCIQDDIGDHMVMVSGIVMAVRIVLMRMAAVIVLHQMNRLGHHLAWPMISRMRHGCGTNEQNDNSRNAARARNPPAKCFCP